jgi:hypothetical protein
MKSSEEKRGTDAGKHVQKARIYLKYLYLSIFCTDNVKCSPRNKSRLKKTELNSSK